MTAVIEVKNLKKTYITPFLRKRVEAVKDVSFQVNRGEVFGFLGPNGAGKTTTIRTMMGLIFASSGSIKLFGHEIPSREARNKLGFLPEAPYFYDYLTLDELIDLTGRLFRLDAKERRIRADKLVELVGMKHARQKPLKSYSKGMLQRAGIAQALVNDPELVVFDEPMGGLDPVGRKEVRDIIFSLRDQGKTVFFSSHILADVEMVADRIAIVTKGRVSEVGTLRELVSDSLRHTEITVRKESQEFSIPDSDFVEETRERNDEVRLRLKAGANVDEFVAKLRTSGAKIVSVVPANETLEDVFVRRAKEQEA